MENYLIFVSGTDNKSFSAVLRYVVCGNFDLGQPTPFETLSLSCRQGLSQRPLGGAAAFSLKNAYLIARIHVHSHTITRNMSE